tara:strand:+ start:2090 stop:2674 length:585 start_codon:yes stop_codon:yes gene_type:complete
MSQISPLNLVYQKGKFGDFENKNEKNLLKISELTNILIFQIVKFKNSTYDIDKIQIDNLFLPNSLQVSSNLDTRILWFGPNNWLVVSSKLDLLSKEEKKFDEQNFALTDLSHSKIIIEIEGNLTNEVLKKGCPLNIDNFKEGNNANSIYNGITITIDCISDSPKKVRIFGLRSFGESLYHSITDASMEYGYIII